MNLNFDVNLALDYSSSTQKARILTESWVANNMYCPRCGNVYIRHFPNNSPVADFYCPECNNEYELKSKAGPIDNKVNDGAYFTMIERITSYKNPDFLFMNYSKNDYRVKDLIIIPKHFFIPDIIEKRKPLSETAKRAGWIGCNIILNQIPNQGKIHIIKNYEEIDKALVLQRVTYSRRLEFNDIHIRGWLFDVLNCINKISSDYFSLADVYKYTKSLAEKHPQNNNVEAKIRQQLQILRDLGYIDFLGHGRYKKN